MTRKPPFNHHPSHMGDLLMKTRRAFTLMEILVVIAIITLLIGILVPALSSARRRANEMKSSTQLRGIQNSFVSYGARNGGWYTGMNSQGQFVTYDYRYIPRTGGGTPPQASYAPDTAFWYLIYESLLTPADLISPVDTTRQPYTGDFSTTPLPTPGAPGFSDDGSADWRPRYSYSILVTGNYSGGAYQQPTRRSLWRDNGNSQLPVACDRAINNDTDGSALPEYRSIHTNPDPDVTEWEGFVAWNDGHVTREQSADVATRVSDATNDPLDNLFDNLGRDNNPSFTNNIRMTHQAPDGDPTHAAD